MSIQSSVNNVLAFASAYKVANTAFQKEKFINPTAPKGQRIKKESAMSKRELMRQRAFANAMDEHKARMQQIRAFHDYRTGGKF